MSENPGLKDSDTPSLPTHETVVPFDIDFRENSFQGGQEIGKHALVSSYIALHIALRDVHLAMSTDSCTLHIMEDTSVG